ncbi:MAG: hypothetical protein AAF587_27955 [Bacteroidota bacterium]
MESYLLQWPVHEQWKISHAKVEEGGRAVVLEFQRVPQEKGAARVSLTSIAGVPSMKLSDIVERQLIAQRNQHPEIQHEVIGESTGSPSSITFVIEQMKEGATLRSSLNHAVMGKKGLYLLVMLHNEATLPPYVRAKWSQFFQSGTVVEQALTTSLAQSGVIGGDLPELFVSGPQALSVPESEQKEQIEMDSWKSDPRILGQSHPEHPDEIPLWTSDLNQEPRPMRKLWVRLLGHQDDIWQGLVIHPESSEKEALYQDVIHLQWSEARQAFFHVSALYLAERREWSITPCQCCGFEGLLQAPSELIEKGKLHSGVLCPFCGGTQTLEHYSYLPDLVREEEAIPLSWWQKIFARFKIR